MEKNLIGFPRILMTIPYVSYRRVRSVATEALLSRRVFILNTYCCFAMDREAYVALERFPPKGDTGDSHQNTAKTRSGFFPLKAVARAGAFSNQGIYATPQAVENISSR